MGRLLHLDPWTEKPAVALGGKFLTFSNKNANPPYDTHCTALWNTNGIFQPLFAFLNLVLSWIVLNSCNFKILQNWVSPFSDATHLPPNSEPNTTVSVCVCVCFLRVCVCVGCRGWALKLRLHGSVNSLYWPSCFYLIRFQFFRLGLLAAHCYASCAAACCRSADSTCFHIDYTSGISADANVRLCICEKLCVQWASVIRE